MSASFSAFSGTSLTPSDRLLKVRIAASTGADQAAALLWTASCFASRIRFDHGVGIAWLRSTCGVCAFCTTGRENLCERSTYTGWTHDGGYATSCCVPEAFAYPVPAVFDDAEAAPLLCAGIIGYRALRRSQVPRGGRLALFGFGSSAHITLQVARHWGCTVYAATRDAAHRRLDAAPPGKGAVVRRVERERCGVVGERLDKFTRLLPRQRPPAVAPGRERG